MTRRPRQKSTRMVDHDGFPFALTAELELFIKLHSDALSEEEMRKLLLSLVALVKLCADDLWSRHRTAIDTEDTTK